MADQAVGELIRATAIGATDLFVLEQSGVAKSLPGQVLVNFLVNLADGHGGIQKIEKLKTSGLVDTYRITLADTTTFDFTVNNGRGITGIAKSGTSGLTDTYRISYNDGTNSTFTVTNGAKGDKGDNAYMWVKYASQQPNAGSHSMGDIPDNWIGIYTGYKSSAPTNWQEYKWFKWKGEKGDVGTPAQMNAQKVEYKVGDSGSIIPSGSWQSNVPVTPQGKYLWTRTTLTFNSGSPVVSYAVSHQGLDGSGSVSSVAGIAPNPQGDVALTADDIGALPTSGGGMTGGINMNGQPINGLNAPSGANDAANKQYVDDSLKAGKTYTDSRITWKTATLSTSWSGSGPYTQTVSVPGIPSNAKAVTCWPDWSADAATRSAQREAWNLVSRIVPRAGAIDFTCDDGKPATAVPMRIEVQL